MPRPKKSGPEFRSSDREMAKKMLREYFQQKGGAEYMRNAQQPSMFQDTETGEYIARPQSFGGGGKVLKYENGGPGPVGSAHSDQKFRVIPEKSPTGQTELAYYIDGRPVESQDFMEQFYAVGNKPQDLNQLIENSVIASKQGVGAESLISGGSPLEGLMKQYRDALKERNVYREQGAAGIDSLYNARQQNYEEMLRRMGG